MSWHDFLAQVLAVTSYFNFKIALVLFILCAIGEIGMGLPYILEDHLAIGRLQPWLITRSARPICVTSGWWRRPAGRPVLWCCFIPVSWV